MSNPRPIYHAYKHMLFSRFHFEAGICAVIPEGITTTEAADPENQTMDDSPSFSSLHLSDSGQKISKEEEQPHSYIGHNNLHLKRRQLQIVQSTDPHYKTSKPTKKSCELLTAINYPIEASDLNVVVKNLTRREEVFIPLLFDEEKFGTYVFPWVSHPKEPIHAQNAAFKETFQGFSEFVTAVCMFGSSLRGIDQLGHPQPLIKHDIKLFPNQKIVFIDYNSNGPQPLRDITFLQLEKAAFLINKFSGSKKEKKITIHLPWIDYILFGLDLYVKKDISHKAMLTLIAIIMSEKKIYMRKIDEIYSRHNIKVTFTSPFDNLFPAFSEDDHRFLELFDVKKNFNFDRLHQICQVIFDAVEIPLEKNKNARKSDVALDPEAKKEHGKKLSQTCLTKLLKNEFNTKQHIVWNMISNQFNLTQKINRIEDLFKYANALVLATLSYQKNKYEVCSLLPLTEKQIQVEYSRMNFPPIYMMTYIEPIYGFDSLLKEEYSLFYYNHAQHDNLMKAVSKGLIETAYKNIYLFWNNASSKRNTEELDNKPHEINEILKDKANKSGLR